ncbi:endonuclease/exonuclease/phosphatase family protein [Flavobacterium sp. GT3P67]|uniref:endonuclease/exonuclease/phosphatase family protein n=1 Tax=Flavobacterium sp. GT3P67 TaxID=2541722 RepID=UPI00104C3435|nr:endonuclease/exonuclease/phosphatase family protein [Flavobacterium sp. GT3P67]TDE49082.1 T9SS type A sorting domain-containing protein [Flavobacterium sp. GT3P67]
MKRLLLILIAFAFLSNVSAQTVTTNKASYTIGEAITVNFTGSTTAKDWIGLFLQTTTPASGTNVGWLYTSGTQTASKKNIASGTVTFSSGIATAGNYKACLLANNGYTIKAMVNFTVGATSAVPVAAFTASATSVVTGGSTTFTDQSTGTPTSWSWSFVGGTPSTSTAKNPTVTYNTNGTYAVTLTATNANGVNTLTKNGYITVADQGANISLKVMQFNVWQEGTSVPNGMTYIRDVINSVNPDIVCFSEVRNYTGDWTTKIVNDLAAVGKTYYRGYITGSDVSIISKYPISLSGPVLAGAVVVYDVNVNGTTVVVCSSHLDYTYYATYLPRGYACGGSGRYAGWNALSPFTPEISLTAISGQNLGSQRDEQIAAFILYMQTETRPILLLGDFNEPSCLDWTSRQANLYDHHGVVYQWDTTLSLNNNGFTDAYRQVYPDVVLNPGISWPAVATNGGASTSWTPLSDERDRIDYIFYKGAGVRATSAAIVGPVGAYAYNLATTAGNGSDIFEASTLPWPSDHKAVVATISIPATIPATLREKNSKKSLKNSSLEIKAYPNPSNGLITLVSSENASTQIIVSDLAGREIFNKAIDLKANNQNTIDLAASSNGIYFIKVISQEKTQTIKIIKE